MRKFSSYLLVTLKGIAMGAADVIPGVSGGTIAFLTGIYEELIDSIKAIDFKALKLLFTGKIGQFWKKINGNFLFSVLMGILISVFTLARLMKYLMENHPVALWSFFFGLIIASAIYILRDIKKWSFSNILSLLVGVALGAIICLLSPSETPSGLWFIFLSGAIAICAMILPGISGSFILLLMGKYHYIVIESINGLFSNFGHYFPILLVFAFGALIGIIAFSHVLSWLLRKFYSATICLLSGFMIGSLLKVWPWQETVTDILPSEAGDAIASAVSRPAPPSGHILEAVIFAIIGIALVFVIEFLANNLKKQN